MPSRADERRPRIALAALLAALWLYCALAPSPGLAQSAGDRPADEDIAAAVEALKADPNLSQERKTRRLRWNREDQPRRNSDFGRWFANFFSWLGQLSRALVWIVGGLLAFALAWFVLRLVREVGPIGAQARLVVPTHVRDLDIRPESLPDDIGAAALALWRRGEQRPALALLYRGLLSRLVHVHEIPLRDSSTEGDCLTLASQRLPAERREYVARLIGVWQRAIYGGRDPAPDDVEALCTGFDAALAPAPNAGGRPQ